MSFLKRPSGNFWPFTSPRKTDTNTKTPQTAPPGRKRSYRPHSPRRVSLDDVLADNSLMDAFDRVDTWSERQLGKKRKYLSTPSESDEGGRRKKVRTMEVHDDEDMESTASLDEDIAMDVEDNDESSLSSAMDNVNIAKRDSPSHHGKGYEYPDSDIDVDDTVVVDEAEYYGTTPPAGKSKIISPTSEHFIRGVDTDQLAGMGWNQDHITLMQKIAMRGFEPLMPAYWKFNYSFMPDALFSKTDDAFVSSVRSDHFRAIAAFEKLMEIGGRVRDRVLLDGNTKPEQQSVSQIKTFMRWAEKDADLDARVVPPLMVFERGTTGSDGKRLEQRARRKCVKLAEKWRDALRVEQSIEYSSSSPLSDLPAELPTLYAIVASGTIVALAAYNPNAEKPTVHSAAFFDMQDPSYDVWNALAIAILVCHTRNVRAHIVEEKGLGMSDGGSRSRSRGFSADPDA